MSLDPPVDALTRMVLAKLLQDQELLRLIRSTAGGVTRTITGSGTVVPGPHSHVPADIVGLTEFIQDTVAALLVAGTGIELDYDDPGGQLTISTVTSGFQIVFDNAGNVVLDNAGNIVTSGA